MDNASGQKKVIIATTLWFILAVIAGVSGLTQNMVPPLPQVVLIGLVFLLLLFFWVLQSFRSWILTVDIRFLVGVHLTRFVGFYFLYLYSVKRLPYDFAVLGGWGDIIVAALALLLILLAPISTKKGAFAYIIWNIIGLLDILFVVATATRLAIRDPQSMGELLKLPLSLLPTFLVPIIIFTHIIIFVRLLKVIRSS